MRPVSTSGIHVDVLIVGAGLSGIGAACHLESKMPGKRYAILERRHTIGGTWDLFRYPGVRSDSDMHTLGYRFRPWHGPEVLAGGPAIRDYVEATAREYGVTDRIRFGHRATRYSWDSGAKAWTVEFDSADGPGSISCDFLWNCTGYYDYDEPYSPTFPGIEEYAGRVVHPQFWQEDVDYDGMRVVVIGSGATAVTLVPAMAERAGHVTMLQRTPSYILPVPGQDPLASRMGKLSSERVAAGVTRWRNVLLQVGLYQFAQRRPGQARRLIRRIQEKALPEGFDLDKHLTPPYDPWDQRLCIVPDGDLFRAIRDGSAAIATGRIDRFTERGIRLTDGTELEADLVVTATGLALQAFGGAEVYVDGERMKPAERLSYRGVMLDDVPNFAYVVGYANASWTLKADLVSEYVVRLLTRMDGNGERVVRPVRPEGVGTRPLIDLESGYVLRALDSFPKQGDRGPWRTPHNYLRDVVMLRLRPLEDGALEFS